MSIDLFHDQVKAICGDNLGVVLHNRYLEEFLSRNIQSTVQNLNTVGGLPTSINGVNVGLRVPAGTVIHVNIGNLGGPAQTPSVQFDPFRIDLLLFRSGTPADLFSTVEIDFTNIIAEIA